MHKIEIIKMGAYVAYLYRRKNIFWWELIANSIDNHDPFHKRVCKWKAKFNIPDKKVYVVENGKKRYFATNDCKDYGAMAD